MDGVEIDLKTLILENACLVLPTFPLSCKMNFYLFIWLLYYIMCVRPNCLFEILIMQGLLEPSLQVLKVDGNPLRRYIKYYLEFMQFNVVSKSQYSSMNNIVSFSNACQI